MNAAAIAATFGILGALLLAMPALPGWGFGAFVISNVAWLLVSARRSFAVREGRFRAGVGNILELLGAQSAVAAAEQRRIEAHAGWLTARLKLAASIGRLGLWAIR